MVDIPSQRRLRRANLNSALTGQSQLDWLGLSLVCALLPVPQARTNPKQNLLIGSAILALAKLSSRPGLARGLLVYAPLCYPHIGALDAVAGEHANAIGQCSNGRCANLPPFV
ncbi:hypothetical protein BASA62_002768 [Batrachochytrium salamandrivorans]|nr:hypothetical protein BASA62_002768 [Batrachochytrium salamandrivorans]